MFNLINARQYPRLHTLCQHVSEPARFQHFDSRLCRPRRTGHSPPQLRRIHAFLILINNQVSSVSCHGLSEHPMIGVQNSPRIKALDGRFKLQECISMFVTAWKPNSPTPFAGFARHWPANPGESQSETQLLLNIILFISN